MAGEEVLLCGTRKHPVKGAGMRSKVVQGSMALPCGEVGKTRYGRKYIEGLIFG